MKNHKTTPTLGAFESIAERNEEILKDYQSGMMMIDMVAKYRLTSTRLYKILGLLRGIDNSK